MALATNGDKLDGRITLWPIDPDPPEPPSRMSTAERNGVRWIADGHRSPRSFVVIALCAWVGKSRDGGACAPVEKRLVSERRCIRPTCGHYYDYNPCCLAGRLKDDLTSSPFLGWRHVKGHNQRSSRTRL